MYGITELKKGTLIELDGNPYQVVDYSQKAMGRGGSVVNVRVKSLMDGRVLDKTFKGSDKINKAQVATKEVQFLYADDESAYFMDSATFEQFSIAKDSVADRLDFLPEGAKAKLQIFEGRPIGLELPLKVPLKVVSAPAAVKGDTQSTVMKEAVLEPGGKLQVPSFIKSGDIIIVDTRESGAYVERAKK